MTGCAVVGESRFDVIGIGCSRNVALMARDAGAGSISIAAGMTSHASHAAVGAGERESGSCMVERTRTPGRSGMTGGAIVIEVVLQVIRVSRRSEVTGVAIETSARGIRVSGRMAGNASQRRMRTGQAEASCTVVKVCGFPCRSGMTGGAIVIEVVLLVIRLGCRGEVAGVAVETGARSICVSGSMA